MDARQLEIAVAAIDHGGFTRAAQALGISQPSVSQAVRRLEDDLGVALFRRVGRSVVLTEAGTAFEGPARAVLRDLAVLRTTVARHRDVAAGVLRIGMLPTLAATLANGVIAEFRRRHPEVAVRIVDERRPDRLVEMVADGRCELVFTESRTRRPGLVTVPLGRQELVAILPPRTPAPRALDAAALAELPLVLAPPGTSVRIQVEEMLERAGHTTRIGVEVPQRDAIVTLVAAGAGASVVPPEQAAEAAAAGARVVPLDPPLWRELSLIHPDADLSPAAAAMLAIARRPGGSAPARRRRQPSAARAES